MPNGPVEQTVQLETLTDKQLLEEAFQEVVVRRVVEPQRPRVLHVLTELRVKVRVRVVERVRDRVKVKVRVRVWVRG